MTAGSSHVRGLPPGELQPRARALLPGPVSAYLDGGAGQERTLAAAEQGLGGVRPAAGSARRRRSP